MKPRPLTAAFVLGLLTTTCTPGESIPAGDASTPAVAAAVAGEAAVPSSPPTPPAPPLLDVAPLPGATIHSISMSLVVADPTRALERAEQALRKLGGEVTYASANGDSASLNGHVPVDARHRLRDALASLATEVQSENMSASDIGHEIRRLRRRLLALQQADTVVAATAAAGEDPTRIEAAALLRELTERERQTVESQLHNYLVQTRDGQVNVSFVRPTAPP